MGIYQAWRPRWFVAFESTFKRIHAKLHASHLEPTENQKDNHPLLAPLGIARLGIAKLKLTPPVSDWVRIALNQGFRRKDPQAAESGSPAEGAFVFVICISGTIHMINTVDGRNPATHHFKTMGNLLFVGIYRGIIIPGFPGQCRISSIHSIITVIITIIIHFVLFFSQKYVFKIFKNTIDLVLFFFGNALLCPI